MPIDLKQLAEQAMHAPGLDGEADIGKRPHAGEGFPDRFERQKTGHGVLPPLGARQGRRAHSHECD